MILHLNALASATQVSIFYATSRSCGDSKIWLNLHQAVLTPNLCIRVKKNPFSLNNRAKQDENTTHVGIAASDILQLTSMTLILKPKKNNVLKILLISRHIVLL